MCIRDRVCSFSTLARLLSRFEFAVLMSITTNNVVLSLKLAIDGDVHLNRTYISYYHHRQIYKTQRLDSSTNNRAAEAVATPGYR